MRKHGSLVLAVALTVGGCQSTEADICEAECACEGCTQSQHNECLNDYEADAIAADYRGCPHLYGALVDCRDATGICKEDGDYDTSCKPEKESLKDCIG